MRFVDTPPKTVLALGFLLSHVFAFPAVGILSETGSVTTTTDDYIEVIVTIPCTTTTTTVPVNTETAGVTNTIILVSSTPTTATLPSPSTVYATSSEAVPISVTVTSADITSSFNNHASIAVTTEASATILSSSALFTETEVYSDLGGKCGGFIASAHQCKAGLVCLLNFHAPDMPGICQLPATTEITVATYIIGTASTKGFTSAAETASATESQAVFITSEHHNTPIESTSISTETEKASVIFGTNISVGSTVVFHKTTASASEKITGITSETEKITTIGASALVSRVSTQAVSLTAINLRTRTKSTSIATETEKTIEAASTQVFSPTSVNPTAGTQSTNVITETEHATEITSAPKSAMAVSAVSSATSTGKIVIVTVTETVASFTGIVAVSSFSQNANTIAFTTAEIKSKSEKTPVSSTLTFKLTASETASATETAVPVLPASSVLITKQIGTKSVTSNNGLATATLATIKTAKSISTAIPSIVAMTATESEIASTQVVSKLNTTDTVSSPLLPPVKTIFVTVTVVKHDVMTVTELKSFTDTVTVYVTAPSPQATVNTIATTTFAATEIATV
ncbi:hypothetical protein HK100_010760 [Physocladia obscura]|uniref:Uncharacterized protein n=1 Tax=Physocladia obscura TaxID=109957 RepID=A0AAD5XDP3_9FUNG|nr:hypothetical protein HK100_010760 [Physocladia obscura]